MGREDYSCPSQQVDSNTLLPSGLRKAVVLIKCYLYVSHPSAILVYVLGGRERVKAEWGCGGGRVCKELIVMPPPPPVFPITPRDWYYYYPYFLGEETEAQRSQTTCPISHNNKGQNWKLKPGPESLPYTGCELAKRELDEEKLGWGWGAVNRE